jgi:carbonic anhydrase
MKKQSSLTPNLDILLKEIEPAAEKALMLQKSGRKGEDHAGSLNDIVDSAIQLNVQHTIEQLLRSSAHLRELQAAGNFKIVGAVYDIADGEVRFLGAPKAAQDQKTMAVQNTVPTLP